LLLLLLRFKSMLLWLIDPITEVVPLALDGISCTYMLVQVVGGRAHNISPRLLEGIDLVVGA
jgi:hypothetical protein